MSKRVHIVFQPVEYHGHHHLLFVGVTDDNGLAIPDKRLEWSADGDFEQLTIITHEAPIPTQQDS